jgi:hypothetical protein
MAGEKPSKNDRKGVSRKKGGMPQSSVCKKIKDQTKGSSLDERIQAVSKEIEARKKRHPLDPVLFFKILDELLMPDPETGRPRTLSEVLKQPGMPSRATFYRWLDADKSGLLRKEYALAGQVHYDEMHDERIRLAYDASTDIVMKETSNGEVVPDINMYSVPRTKEIIRTLEWTMTRLAPNKYGDHIQIDAGVDASPQAIEALVKLGAEKRRQAQINAEEHAAIIREKMQGLLGAAQ